jgi:hypothetical protein
MKTIRIILAAALLFTISAMSGPASAQESSQESKEKDLKSLEDFYAQKKTTEQKKAYQDQKAAMDEQQKAIQEAIKNAKEQIDMATQHGDLMKIYKDLPKMNGEVMNEPFMYMPELGWQNFHWDENSERSSWNFTKSVKENSFSRDYTFDVDPGSNSVVMSVNGDCKAGDIRIKIIMPNGKTYSDIVIDESGNLNWRKSFQMSDEENKDKAGAWKFQINASKATGFFKISLQTY